MPLLIHDTKPRYTHAALRAKVEGLIVMDAVVMPDGSVGDVHVTRSLDGTFGLDEEAMRTVREWRFAPGYLDDKPVPVRVAIEMRFTLR